MLKTLYRIVRAMAFSAALLGLPALTIYGYLHGWGFANYVAAWGLGALATLGLLVVASPEIMSGPGYGGPAISGDEVGRPMG